MSMPSVYAVSVSRLPAAVMAASVMPRLVALVALHAFVVGTTVVSTDRISAFQSASRCLSVMLMFFAARASMSALHRSRMLLPCMTR